MSAFIDQQRGSDAVEFICKTIGVSASAYYARKMRGPSARALRDAELLEVIRETHAANYHAYGYRRMWKALLREGVAVPRCQVQRLMRDSGIVGAKRRGRPWRTTVPGSERPDTPDLLERDFTAAAQRGVGRGLHLRALLGGHGVLQLRDRRVQPPHRWLATRLAHAHQPGSGRSGHGRQRTPGG